VVPTAVANAHLPRSAKAEPRVEGSVGEAMGGPVGYNSPQEDFYKSLQPNMENFSHSIYTQSIQAPFISKIGWLFHLHKHTDLHHLTELLEGLLHWINPNDPPIALGFQFKNIWDGSKTPKAIPPLATGLPNIPPLLSNPNAKS